MIEQSELTKCCDCNNDFRQPANGSTIKLKRCFRCQNLADFNKSKERIEKNKILLSQATLYAKKERTQAKTVVSTVKENNGLKTSEKRSKRNIDEQLDEAWSMAVKKKAGFKCQVCFNTKSLNSHHIYSRAKKSVRWDLDNGVCLCVNHHIGFVFSAHKTPVEFTEWLKFKFGDEFMKKLSMKASATSHLSVNDKEFILIELKKFTNATIQVTESIPPEYCTFERLEKLKQAGFETDGHIDQLKQIIVDSGYPLPSHEGEHYGFVFNQKYTRLYLTLVDAMAEEILMLKEFKMI